MQQRQATGETAVRSVGCGLPRASRLPPAGYREVFASGRSRAGRFLVLWVLENDARQGRMGTVASRRTLRLAVTRNRARRLMREAYRLNRGHLHAGWDMILLARARIDKAGYAQVADDFRRLCRAAGIWRGDADS